MVLSLERFIDDFSSALKKIDAGGVVYKTYRPGIGPFSESEAVKLVLNVLLKENSNVYEGTVTKRQPDLLIPNKWQIEFKIIRPFGDNGKEAESWSQNLLHPYRGNTSTIGDCFKLMSASGPEKRAVVVFGYEDNPAKISLEPCIRAFEILASNLLKIKLSERIQRKTGGLIHPVHQVLWVFGWEVFKQKTFLRPAQEGKS